MTSLAAAVQDEVRRSDDHRFNGRARIHDRPRPTIGDETAVSRERGDLGYMLDQGGRKPENGIGLGMKRAVRCADEYRGCASIVRVLDLDEMGAFRRRRFGEQSNLERVGAIYQAA